MHKLLDDHNRNFLQLDTIFDETFLHNMGLLQKILHYCEKSSDMLCEVFFEYVLHLRSKISILYQ